MPDLPLFRAIDVVPRHAYDFLWADYVELLCLCSRNGCVSSGNVQALTQETQDVQTDCDEEPHVHEDPEVLDDRVAKRWTDIRRRFQTRSASWPAWPFVLDGSVLNSVYDGKNPEHRLYVALLIASSVRLCHEDRRGEVTNAFEEISYYWLKQSLNDLWVVRPFGAHQTLQNAYTGTLHAKLEALAGDLKARLQKPADAYDPSDTGDGGIDLVAWMRMGDQRGNLPVIFGQCACSPTDWESKQLSVSGPSVEAHIAPQHQGAAYCFVPHDLQMSDTQWQRASHVLRTVVVDRARILELFRATKTLAALPTWTFVDEPSQIQATMAV